MSNTKNRSPYIYIILKVIVSLAITLFTVRNYTPATHADVIAIAGPLSTVAGILFGFVIASTTFISSNTNNILISNMKNTRMHGRLIDELSRTGAALILSCTCMVISIFMPSEKILSNMTVDYAFLSVGFFVLCFGLFEFWSCWRKIIEVAKNM